MVKFRKNHGSAAFIIMSFKIVIAFIYLGITHTNIFHVPSFDKLQSKYRNSFKDSLAAQLALLNLLLINHWGHLTNLNLTPNSKVFFKPRYNFNFFKCCLLDAHSPILLK